MDGQCQGTNRNGEPCSAPTLPKSAWCHWHDPSREEIRRESRQRGGRNRSAEARARKAIQQLPTLGNVNDVLKIAMIEVYEGTLDPKVYNAMCNGAARIKDLSITTEYGEEIESQRDELARLRRERPA